MVKMSCPLCGQQVLANKPLQHCPTRGCRGKLRELPQAPQASQAHAAEPEPIALPADEPVAEEPVHTEVKRSKRRKE